MANKREKKRKEKAEVFSELRTLMGIVEDVSEPKKNTSSMTLRCKRRQ